MQRHPAPLFRHHAKGAGGLHHLQHDGLLLLEAGQDHIAAGLNGDVVHLLPAAAHHIPGGTDGTAVFKQPHPQAVFPIHPALLHRAAQAQRSQQAVCRGLWQVHRLRQLPQRHGAALLGQAVQQRQRLHHRLDVPSLCPLSHSGAPSPPGGRSIPLQWRLRSPAASPRR